MGEIQNDRLSIVVGVTGHRDIAAEDEAPLRAAFGRILEQLARRCPHTPLVVLSGLAAGADSLAAEEALARNVPLVACLPMPVEEYEKDFSAQQLASFRTTLAAASRVILTSQRREQGYIAAGRFIAQYSHLMVAFWDGESARGAGGTADVIEMRMTGRSGEFGVEDIPYLPDIGPVDLVLTPRANGPRPARPFSVKRLYPKRVGHQEPAVASNFDSILARIDGYNDDLAHVSPTSAKSPLEDLMLRTDAAANHLQRKTRRFQWLLLGIAFVAAGFQVVAHVPPIAKVIGLAAAFFAYRTAQKHDYENRYQDYRAVAEGLRVQNAWHCAGLSGHLVDNEYLRMQESELQWIRMALRFFYLIYCEGFARTSGAQDDAICEDWIRSQWEYYDRASRRERGRKRLFERITAGSLAFGLLCAAVSALVLRNRLGCALAIRCPHDFHPTLGFEILQNLLTAPIALAAVIGAVLAHVDEKENLVGSARRYERMFRVFDRARRDLSAIGHGKPGDAQEILYQLGRAALIEHADWLIMRRDRPMRVVVV